MKSLVKKTGLRVAATLSIIIASQIGVFAATTTGNDSTSMSPVSVLGCTALVIAVVILPLFKGTERDNVKG